MAHQYSKKMFQQGRSDSQAEFGQNLDLKMVTKSLYDKRNSQGKPKYGNGESIVDFQFAAIPNQKSPSKRSINLFKVKRSDKRFSDSKRALPSTELQ